MCLRNAKTEYITWKETQASVTLAFRSVATPTDGHHISMEHHLWRKHLQSKKYKKKDKEDTFCLRKKKNGKKNEKHESEVTLKWATPNPVTTEAQKDQIFTKETPFCNKNFSTIKKKRRRKNGKIKEKKKLKKQKIEEKRKRKNLTKNEKKEIMEKRKKCKNEKRKMEKMKKTEEK